MLTEIVPIIRKLSERENLTAEEAKRAFDIVIREDQESYYFFALTLALHTKGETTDELLGFCRSIKEITPQVEVKGLDPKNTIDVSGTGGDPLNTLNVSTATAFVVASGGVAVPKQTFFAVTGYSGSADLLDSFGIDVWALSADPERVAGLLERTNLATYHFLLTLPEACSGMTKWMLKRREIGLNYITPLHFVAFAYSPFPMERRIYGVFDERYLRPLAEVFQGLGYKKGFVVHGIGGLDEVSVIGPTKVCEFTEKNIAMRMISPDKDFGLRKATASDIASTSREGNIRDFLKVLYGQEQGAKRDIVLANSAAAFYCVDRVEDWKEGAELAASLIDDGKASAKLEEYVGEAGDKSKLEELKGRYLS